MIYNKIIDIYRATLVTPPPEMGGDPYPDWDNPTLVASIPASVQPLSTNEKLVYNDTGTTTILKVYCKFDDVRSTDRVKVDKDGNYFQVNGNPFFYDFKGTSLKYAKFYLTQVLYNG